MAERFVSENVLELRGVEKRNGQGGEYHLFNFEESTGAPVQYYTKDLSLFNSVKKGEMYNVVVEIDFRGKYKNISLVGVIHNGK